ncbi:MAG TPA: hypothetical protein VM489_15575 [Burkholderiales bacterium]|nr:hypothetical protein [Burkholderiales bacterium]
MSLAGEAVVAIWQEPPPESRADYYAWHNGEHMAERVAIPGFLRGRRYQALEGRPEFFTLYEARGLEVLTGPDYLARLNNPTPLTRRVAPLLRSNVRSLCRVALSRGTGQGGLVMTWRYDTAPERAAEQRALLERLLPAIAERPGVCGAHLCLGDRAASGVQTEEKKNRPQAALTPGWIVLVEGSADRALLETACRELSPEALAAAGAAAPIERGLYRLQFSPA